jgi:hypothetical protein
MKAQASTLLLLLLAGCSAGGGGGKHNPGANQGSGGGPDAVIFKPGTTGNDPNIMGEIISETCPADCKDFPADPVMDPDSNPAPPANAAMLFGAPDNMGTSGACILEPSLSDGTPQRPGALFPANWVSPRFRWAPAAGEDLFEVRLSVAKETSNFVAYTRSTKYILPKDVWKAVATNVHMLPITVTIRGINSGSPGKPSGSRGTFQIAPANAGGKMVYWATTSSDVTPMSSSLYGFGVGEDNVIQVLTTPQVKTDGILHENGHDLRGLYSDARGEPVGHVQCIGCHRSTPDGKYVGFTDEWPWNDVFASIEKDTVGYVPDYMTPGARLLLNQPWLGMQTMTPAHWTAGDRIVINTYAKRSTDIGFSDSPGQNTGQRLAWFATDTTTTFPSGVDQTTLNTAIKAAVGTAWGFLDLQGETQNAATPDWSHDGRNIAYTSAGGVQDGRLTTGGEYDLAIVPYNDKKGGPVAKIPGASQPGIAEYYPAYSADDKLIAFNRSGNQAGQIYYRRDGEIFVIPAEGGTAARLAANDPPACGGEASPGSLNSWARWSPKVATKDGKDYYFLVFSSARQYPGAFLVPKNQYSAEDNRASQLYMTSIVRDQMTGQLTTYGAVYVWNQTPATSNLTPAWNDFLIPPAPPIR